MELVAVNTWDGLEQSLIVAELLLLRMQVWVFFGWDWNVFVVTWLQAIDLPRPQCVGEKESSLMMTMSLIERLAFGCIHLYLR